METRNRAAEPGRYFDTRKAWNMSAANLRVAHAKEMLKRVGGRGCIVIVFDDQDGFAVAEWGRDRVECGRLKTLVNAISDKLAAGDLPAP